MLFRSLLGILLVCTLVRSSAQTACVDSSLVFLLNAGSAKIAVRNAIPLADSGVFIFGRILEPSYTHDISFIARLDKFNNIVFSKKLIGEYEIVPGRVLQCANGDILLATMQIVSGQVQAYIPHLHRIDLNGNLVWQKKLSPVYPPVNIFSWIGLFEIAEGPGGAVYLGTSHSEETNSVEGSLTGYYYLHKLSPLGDIIWKTTLVANDIHFNYINAVTERNGEVLIAAQQTVAGGGLSCNSPNQKTVALFKLDADNGSVLFSKSHCLNFQNPQCLGSADASNNSAKILDDGRIIISGRIALCGQYPSFLLLFDNNFDNLSAYSYNYAVPYTISTGITRTNQFGEALFLARGYNNLSFLYATLLPDGTIKNQRKMEFPPGIELSTGGFSPLFKQHDNFMLFTNQTEDGSESLRVIEIKGNNNESFDCTGKDSSFITSQPHTLAPVDFAWDTVRTETVTAINTNFSLQDFSFNREEVCSSVSICDSMKIIGPDSVCLNAPRQTFSVYRNPGCLKLPKWRIDLSVVQEMQPINDTAVSIRFKEAWEGYLYTNSDACGFLSDSLYIKVLASPPPVQLGNDAVFCAPVILNAGDGFASYSWQDGSSGQQFTVTGEGAYYVTATDICGNFFSDTIIFTAPLTTFFIGADTCISSFPHTISAGDGYINYSWQDGSSLSRFEAASPGQYFVEVTNACNKNFSDSIIIYQRIESFSLGTDTTICTGTAILLQAPQGFPVYRWQDNSNSNSYHADRAGIYYVSVEDACGNIIKDSITIIPLSLQLFAGNDTIICGGEKISLRASAGFMNYSWQPDYRISNGSGREVWVDPDISTAYIVSAEKQPGCFASDTVLVAVKDCPQHVHIPSAFTPNQDGKNDLFKPIVSGIPELYEFIVYNRWGQVVFKSNDPLRGWDGSLNGRPSDNAVFAWSCRYKFPNQTAVMKKGTVMLIR